MNLIESYGSFYVNSEEGAVVLQVEQASRQVGRVFIA
jgi:hypothetical protein